MPPAYTRYSPLASAAETLTAKPLACAECTSRSALSRLANSPSCTAQTPPLRVPDGTWRALALTDGGCALVTAVVLAAIAAGVDVGAGAAAGVGVGADE